MCGKLPVLVLIALPGIALPASAAPLVLYVSPAGDDAWSGRLADPSVARDDGPLRTLEHARDEVRRLGEAGEIPVGGAEVELRAGVYELPQTFVLSARDSGTADRPIVYRSRPGDEVRLVGGRVIEGWGPVADPTILARLDPAARGAVLQADLRAQGMTDLGQMLPGQTWGASDPGLEVFFADEPMTLARYPNEGYITIPEVYGEKPQDIRGTTGFMDGIIGYEGDRPERWVGEKDVMLEGYWFWDWADQRLRIQSIDTDAKRIMLDPEPQHGFGFRKGMYYYAYNLLPELDRPGEWYLDRDAGILYFWPPAPLDTGKVIVSVLPTLVTMQDTAYVTLRGLTFEGTRGTALSLGNVDHVRVECSVIRNTGGWGLDLSGRDSGVVGCDLYNLASGGISMEGGDRASLTPANLYVDNCHFYRFGRWNPICKPGVNVNGVGNRVTHCLFNDAPHMAIMWGGNDHLFEYNEFHSVVRESNDAGIMYAGYNPAMRGHVIRYNHFHDVYGFAGKGCNGVYLDDMFCSATIYGNIFQRVPRAAFIGGGHDNVVENNIFVDCDPALHVDARMMGWASASVPIMKERLEQVPYQQEPWRSRYPQLLTYLEGNYAEPRGNLVARNICVGGRWDEIEGLALPGVKLEDNLVGEDPGFVDAAHGDFRLQPDSPAFALGFRPIPVESIGLYQDPLRVTWPVVTQVRYPDNMPAPAAEVPAQTGPPPVFAVPLMAAEVVVDGRLDEPAWTTDDGAPRMAVEQDLEGGPVEATRRTEARLWHDGICLYVAAANLVNPGAKLKMGDTWGANDAVELAFSNPALGPGAPLLILRGYPSGHFASSNEAGAPAEAVTQAARGVEYGARVVGDDLWTAEWRVPFASLGVDPQAHRQIAFNLSVRKIGGPEWVLWVGTNHATWNVRKAGFLELD